MKFDMTQELVDLQDNVIKDNELFDNPDFVDTKETPNEQPKHKRLIPMTLGSVCIAALHANLSKDKELTGGQKANLFLISTKIVGNKEAHLKIDDIKIIKDRVGEAYGTLIVGRVFEVLDPEQPEEDNEND